MPATAGEAECEQVAHMARQNSLDPGSGSSESGPVARARPVRVVGCGRHHRCDDQVGLRVAAGLRELLADQVEIALTEAPGADLAAGLEGVRLLVVLDAAATTPALPAGAWKRIEYVPGETGPAARPARAATVSAHSLGVLDGLELARALAVLPGQVWIYVLAGTDFGYGEDFSAEVSAALADLVEQVHRDVEGWLSEQAGEPDPRLRV
ncbi:MAG: hydrogenase maturation protease [Planctomycetes bacterium]|nr:hydrogenase maturation protease [Planctomycetota bacterium]